MIYPYQYRLNITWSLTHSALKQALSVKACCWKAFIMVLISHLFSKYLWATLYQHLTPFMNIFYVKELCVRVSRVSSKSVNRVFSFRTQPLKRKCDFDESFATSSSGSKLYLPDLVGLCEGNPLVTDGFPSHWFQQCGALAISLLLVPTSCWSTVKLSMICDDLCDVTITGVADWMRGGHVDHVSLITKVMVGSGFINTKPVMFVNVILRDTTWVGKCKDRIYGKWTYENTYLHRNTTIFISTKCKMAAISYRPQHVSGQIENGYQIWGLWHIRANIRHVHISVSV